jgi:phosphotransacetylase
VAVLAAVETVNTRMSATLDGAILAKMADRRQIVGGVVDGPIDLDAAIDAEAARVSASTRPWRAAPTSCWRPTSRPAT